MMMQQHATSQRSLVTTHHVSRKQGDRLVSLVVCLWRGSGADQAHQHKHDTERLWEPVSCELGFAHPLHKTNAFKKEQPAQNQELHLLVSCNSTPWTPSGLKHTTRHWHYCCSCWLAHTHTQPLRLLSNPCFTATQAQQSAKLPRRSDQGATFMRRPYVAKLTNHDAHTRTHDRSHARDHATSPQHIGYKGAPTSTNRHNQQTSLTGPWHTTKPMLDACRHRIPQSTTANTSTQRVGHRPTALAPDTIPPPCEHHQAGLRTNPAALRPAT